MNDDRHAKRQAGDAETGAQAERRGHADESVGLRRRNGPEHVWAARRQDPPCDSSIALRMTWRGGESLFVEIQEFLVHIAPMPVLDGVQGLDDRMAGCLKVLGCMLHA